MTNEPTLKGFLPSLSMLYVAQRFACILHQVASQELTPKCHDSSMHLRKNQDQNALLKHYPNSLEYEYQAYCSHLSGQ
jgi:hypothetical protein